MSGQHEPEEASRAPGVSEAGQVRVRRSPKILSFLLAGALGGAFLALVLTFAFPTNGEYPASQVFGFLLVLGVVVGASLGGALALILDRASQRRAREVDAIREVTVAAPAEHDDEPQGEAPSEPEAEGSAGDSRS